MADDSDFTPKERAALRRMLQQYEREKTKAAQVRAEQMTKEMRRKYGPLVR